MQRPMRTNERILPLWGVAAWLALALATALGVIGLTLIDLLVTLAPLVIVPIGLGLFDVHSSAARRWRRTAVTATPTGALLAAVSVLLPQGALAAALAATWLLICASISLSGLIDLWHGRTVRPARIIPAAGVAYLSVGAGWLVVSRLGAHPLDFPHTIVELTAVHFHYGGFAAPLIAASALRVLPGRSSVLAQLAGLGIVIGMPLVAAGITFSPIVEAGASVLLAAALFLLALVTLSSIGGVPGGRVGRLLLIVSSLSVIAAMALAGQYALGQLLGTPALSIERMAQLHGIANAFGFTLCGMLGWSLARRASRVG